MSIVGAGTATIMATAAGTNNYDKATASYTLTVTGQSYEVTEVVDPTYTEQGYTVYTCTHCDDSYKDDYTAIRVIDGTDSSYVFTVLHMFTETSTRLGIIAGETEMPTVTKTDDSLVVTLTGLSPVAISWKAVTTSTIETEIADTSGTSACSTTGAETDDETNILLWMVVMLLAASGITIIVIYGRKRKYNR